MTATSIYRFRTDFDSSPVAQNSGGIVAPRGRHGLERAPSVYRAGVVPPSVHLVAPRGPESGPLVEERRVGWARHVTLATMTVLVLGAALALLQARHGKSGLPSVVRDVPHVEGDAIVFSASFRERAGLAFMRVERTRFQPTVRVVGTVAFDPVYVAAIGTRLRGTVRRTFKYEGDHVAVNEPLAEVESAELGSAQASVLQSEASAQAAEVNARRERDLVEKSLTTAREVEVAQAELATQRAALQAAQQRVRALGGGTDFGLYVLRSPIAGDVIERNLAPGQSVDGPVVGYKVADLAHLWIELSVFERDLGSVHVGDEVEVSPLSDPGAKIPGRVAHVGEVIDVLSRSTDVRVTVENPTVHLRPGQSVQATIVSQGAERQVVLVPQTAVVFVDGKPTVFVADGPTRVRAVRVHLGASDGKCHEVLDGVEPGQEVVCGGTFAIKSELFR
jgi:cobalt-zinc-cadmium efflux system membrane fusion protein